MNKLKTCGCGEPTYGNKCGLCASEQGLFKAPEQAEIDELRARNSFLQGQLEGADLVLQERDAEIEKMKLNAEIGSRQIGQLFAHQQEQRTEAVAADIRIGNDALVIAGLTAERDAAQADAKRLEWLSQQGVSFGFQDIYEGNKWEIGGPYATLRIAIDAAMKGEQP